MERALRGAGTGGGLRPRNARCEARGNTALWRPWVLRPSLGGRHREIGALMRTPNAKLVAIDNQTRRGQYNTSFRADDERLKPMREATYTLCPTGDTPESQRIYQAAR